MVLTTARPRDTYIVHAVQGEGDVRLHLEGLGVTPGTKLKVVQRFGGNLIVNIRGSRVAVDKRLAEHVLV